MTTQPDPFQPFDSTKHHPVTPEAPFYGALFMALIVVWAAWRRPRR